MTLFSEPQGDIHLHNYANANTNNRNTNTTSTTTTPTTVKIINNNENNYNVLKLDMELGISSIPYALVLFVEIIKLEFIWARLIPTTAQKTQSSFQTKT